MWKRLPSQIRAHTHTQTNTQNQMDVLRPDHDKDDDEDKCPTWKDLMKVHSRLRMPSERFNSLTRRMTRNSRKNVMDTLAFSESFNTECSISSQYCHDNEDI